MWPLSAASERVQISSRKRAINKPLINKPLWRVQLGQAAIEVVRRDCWNFLTCDDRSGNGRFPCGQEVPIGIFHATPKIDLRGPSHLFELVARH